MAQTITWRDVAAPDLGDSIRTRAAAQNQFLDSLRSLGRVGTEYAANERARGTDAFNAAISAAENPNDVRNILANLSGNVDAAAIASNGRSAIRDLENNARQVELFNRDTARYNNEVSDRDTRIATELLAPQASLLGTTAGRARGELPLDRIGQMSNDPRVSAALQSLGLNAYNPAFATATNRQEAIADRNASYARADALYARQRADALKDREQRVTDARKQTEWEAAFKKAQEDAEKGSAEYQAISRLQNATGASNAEITEFRDDPYAAIEKKLGKEAAEAFRIGYADVNSPYYGGLGLPREAAALMFTYSTRKGSKWKYGWDGIDNEMQREKLPELMRVWTGLSTESPTAPATTAPPGFADTWNMIRDLNATQGPTRPR